MRFLVKCGVRRNASDAQQITKAVDRTVDVGIDSVQDGLQLVGHGAPFGVMKGASYRVRRQFLYAERFSRQVGDRDQSHHRKKHEKQPAVDHSLGSLRPHLYRRIQRDGLTQEALHLGV